jgi:hypothetical protein
MDVNDFQTIGECEIGYTWRVASENKVVVNIGKVALYFEIDEFYIFAKMIDDSVQNLISQDPARKEQSKEQAKKDDKSKIANITQFRASKNNDDDE